MRKDAFIIHGWGGQPNEHWLPWLKEQLEQHGFAVTVPAMPNTDEPRIEEWVNYLAEMVDRPDEHTYFIGHSIGCQTIVRYLATLPAGTTIGGCVFVAGWFKLENLEDEETEQIAQPWLTTPIDFEKVRTATPNITVLLSDNDPYNAVAENERLFKEKLNAHVTILHNNGHFTADDGITELPHVRDAVLMRGRA